MAKKQNISDTILNKFNKPQFQPGAAVCFYWMGRIQYGYVTTIGVFSTWYNRAIKLGIRVVLNMRGKRPNITQDTSTSQPLRHSDQTSSLDASKSSLTPEQLQQYLLTPEGQTMKAEMTIRVADQMLETLAQKSQKQDPNDLAATWMISLALLECTVALQKNQKFLENQS